MNININEVETADYNIIENIKTALIRLWKLKIIVILMTFVGLLVALLYIGIVGNKLYYRANASIYSMVYGSYEDSTDGVKVMNTYSGLLGSTRVCERASASLQERNISADELQNMVRANQIYLVGASSDSKKYGYELTLVTLSSSSDDLVQISNAMANAFVGEINDLLGTKTLQVLDQATRYSSYQTINARLYILLFSLGAFVGTAMIIFIKEFLSTKVFSVAQCEQNRSLILGMIPYGK